MFSFETKSGSKCTNRVYSTNNLRRTCFGQRTNVILYETIAILSVKEIYYHPRCPLGGDKKGEINFDMDHFGK